MFFLPVTFLIFFLFILFLPVLFFLAYFHILTLGFENLGISPQATIFLLFLILLGSGINIPIGRRKWIYRTESRFFGLFQTRRLVQQGVAINLGGAVIPVLLSFYFLFLLRQKGFSLLPVFLVTLLIIFISKSLAKVVPERGISLPPLIPPLFSAIFALILAPKYAAACAFIAGVLGTLIGADLLNIKKAARYPGLISIGGAGVFDGIFLVGIISSLLTGF